MRTSADGRGGVSGAFGTWRNCEDIPYASSGYSLLFLRP